MEYDGRSEEQANSSKNTWVANSITTDRLGRENVFSQFPKEVADLVLQNAKYHLEKIAEELPERRDMYLAYLAQLCYLPNGSSPYGQMKTEMAPHNQPIQVRNVYIFSKGCSLIDTEGVEHMCGDTHMKYISIYPVVTRWKILEVCAHHLGSDAILALFPENMKKLRENYEKRMKELRK